MTKNWLFPAVLAATVALATPAFAQNRHEPHNGGSGSGGRAQARQSNAARQPSQGRVAPSQQQVQPVQPVPAQPAQRAVPRAVPRAENRAYGAPGYQSHQNYQGYQGYQGRAVPRAVAPARPYYYHPYPVRPYYAGPYLGPAYHFHPHSYLHFGIVVGYPVPYAYAYPYPVPVYGYGAPPAPVAVGPSSTQFGGVALQFTPGEASVYVDGGYAGTVADFDGSRNTLTLAAGHHRIEINAPGFEPATIEVDTVPGQIVPYQGSLRPY